MHIYFGSRSNDFVADNIVIQFHALVEYLCLLFMKHTMVIVVIVVVVVVCGKQHAFRKPS